MSIEVFLYVACLESRVWYFGIRNSGETRMDEKQQQPQPGQMQIKADEKELQGLYSNLMMIHHNVEEFTLNFVYIFPNGTQGKLLSTVTVSPAHSNPICRPLAETIPLYTP